MKDMNFLNLYWAIVWGVVFVLAILGFFWKPCLIATTVIAGITFCVFVKEYIRVKRIK